MPLTLSFLPGVGGLSSPSTTVISSESPSVAIWRGSLLAPCLSVFTHISFPGAPTCHSEERSDEESRACAFSKDG